MKSSKTTFNSFLVLLISSSVLAYSCKKHNDDPQLNGSKSVDDLQLSMQHVTTPLAPKDPGDYTVWFSLSGDKIYYGNASNTPGYPQFFLEYSLGNNSFSSKAINNDICACGFESKIISSSSDLYYIANKATKFTVSSNSWAELTYPGNAYDNNGEAGVVYNDNKIYFLGGRTLNTKFKYYDLTNGTWFNVVDGLYALGFSEMAAVNGKIYALGGRDGANNYTSKFSNYSEATGWTALPDLPFQFNTRYDTHLTASFANRYIFALNDNKLYVYDANNNKWGANPLSIDIEGSYLNLLSDNVNLYIAGKTNTNDFMLYKIAVSNY